MSNSAWMPVETAPQQGEFLLAHEEDFTANEKRFKGGEQG